MPILDILKKKEKERKEASKESKAPEKLEKSVHKVSAQKEKKSKEGKKKNYPFAYRILKEPYITEKATKLSENNEYVFKVYPDANKTEIKKSIEALYGVDVLDVRTITVPPKRRRLGRTRGFKKGFKKAIVKIKKGQKIEILPR
ncbi:MAG TPA: 50S ribosomal protein L23 [bacterium]|nr:50S ribosomal protein L23 [bacterium]